MSAGDARAGDGPIRIGVDVGGTFTDIVVWNARSGRILNGKVPTTPDDPSDGILSGVEAILGDADVKPDRVDGFIHGTTLATNALIERKGARTALVTTRGFRDVLEIAREERYDLYDVNIDLPRPLVERRLRLEVVERVLSDGTIDRPISLVGLDDLIVKIEGDGIDAVAISFINAFANPVHEEAAVQRIEASLPTVSVCRSSTVAPEMREYERTSTTVANAYVMPIVRSYLSRLEKRLRNAGIEAAPYVMLSSGGLATLETAKLVPIRLVESGPAAGALAAARAARRNGIDRLLSFDMGGTTAKVCLVDDAQPLLSKEFEVGRQARLTRGSGLPLRIPAIELIEIGAGGGSIAQIDSLGLLRVGPESSGAVPGPACYGRGGTLPTVTDANLVLGYYDPTFFAGGQMTLDSDAASLTIERDVAQPLGISLRDAAWGIQRVVNETMAAAARIHAIERGRDIRRYTMFAFGGAAPAHCWSVAKILNVPRVIVPISAGVMSAHGLLSAPIAFDFVRSFRQILTELDTGRLTELFSDMECEAYHVLGAAGADAGSVTIRRAAEMRYRGQGHEVEVEVPAGTLETWHRDILVERFEESYAALYDHAPLGIDIEAINWRVFASAPSPMADENGAVRAPLGAQACAPSKGMRSAYLGGTSELELPIYDRYALQAGMTFSGPALVEENEATTVVGPDTHCRILDDLGLLMEMGP